MPVQLQNLNREYRVTLTRYYPLDGPQWPVVLVHSPGMAYAFDSDNTGLDSPAAAMRMLEVHGLHELVDPFSPAPEASGWSVLLDRDDDDGARPFLVQTPPPLGPLELRSPQERVDRVWRDVAQARGGWAQLLLVWGVDFDRLTAPEVAVAMVTAGHEHRVAGATVRVHL